MPVASVKAAICGFCSSSLIEDQIATVPSFLAASTSALSLIQLWSAASAGVQASATRTEAVSPRRPRIEPWPAGDGCEDTSAANGMGTSPFHSVLVMSSAGATLPRGVLNCQAAAPYRSASGRAPGCRVWLLLLR